MPLVLYDPDAVIDLVAIKDKTEKKAVFNAVDKLKSLAEARHRVRYRHCPV
jgi:hypothetical protein